MSATLANAPAPAPASVWTPASLVPRKCACGAPASASGGECADCRRKRLLGQRPSLVSPRILAGPSGDPFEHEAERMANLVMSGSSGAGGDARRAATASASGVRGQSLRGRAEPMGRVLFRARQPGPASGPERVDPMTVEVLNSPGRPLDQASRALMEPRFGHDFSRVRIHHDGAAARSAAAAQARAFTTGEHIVFGQGRYAPGTYAGDRLLAHELTHVLQQGSGMAGQVLQRDLAIKPVVANPVERGLSEQDISDAIRFNEQEFDDPYSLAVVRDVIGVSRFPAVSDRSLALAVARWQAQHGLAQDGRLGPVTVTYVIEELQAEGNDSDAVLLMAEFPRGTFLDVDTSFCGCRGELQGEIDDSNFFIGEYQACGSESGVNTGTDVENCIDRRARARGEALSEAGSTSSSGAVRVRRTPGRCGPLVDRITLAHEQIHSVHTRELQQQHGRGTRAFRRAFNDATDWVDDEVNSRRTDIAVAEWAMGILDRICP